MDKKEAKKIDKIKLDYNKSSMFLHCKHCMNKYMKEREKNGGESKESPKDAMKYEAASYPMEFPDKHIENILVVWCSKCGKEVWDSRHLTHRY